MADFKVNFYAYGHAQVHENAVMINMISIGFTKQIVSGKVYPQNTITDLETKFKGLQGKKVSAFNFYWTPYIDNAKKINQGKFFSSISKEVKIYFDLRVQRWDDKGNKLKTLYWNFHEGGVVRVLNSGKNQIVETWFESFDTGDKML